MKVILETLETKQLFWDEGSTISKVFEFVVQEVPHIHGLTINLKIKDTKYAGFDFNIYSDTLTKLPDVNKILEEALEVAVSTMKTTGEEICTQ